MNQGIMPQLPPIQATGGTYRNPGRTQQAASPADPFAMLLMQLLGNREEMQAADPLLSLDPEPEQPSKSEEDLEAAMELMAQLTLGTLPTQNLTPEQAAQAILTGAPIQTPDARLTEALLPKAQAAEGSVQQPQGPLPAAPDSDPGAKFQMPPPVEQPEVLVQPQRLQGEAPALEVFQFQTAVRQAADRLGTQPKAPAQDPPDIEALQAAVEQKQFIPQHRTLVEAAAAQPQAEAKEVIPQLSTGILDNLAAGKDEFIVRLKPEGLGEITVKLVEQEGRVLLSILTSSPQVAKALSQDVASLQQALRPLQAQVQEIAVAEPYAAGQQLAEQNQNHRPGQQQWTDHGPRRGRTPFSLDSVPDLTAPAATPVGPGTLSVYI